MFTALMTWHQQRQTERQLSMLSDRELADIGIERADIPQIARVDPAADKRRRAATSARPGLAMAYDSAPTRA